MKMFKKLFLLPIAAMSLGTITACHVDTSEKLIVWTFTNELKKLVQNYYVKDTGKKVQVVVKSDVQSVVTELMDVWDEGIDIPDVIALESAVVKDTDTQPYLLPLDDIEGTEQMYQYTKDVAKNDEGKIVGLSWQATPGGFFYKKRIADRLNISETQMATYLSSWQGFLDLAELCHQNSVAVVSAITEPVKVFMSAREKSWVDNNVLQLEEVMFGPSSDGVSCHDLVRTLQQEGYTHQTSERATMWYADIDSDDCLGYFASCWGLNFDLMEYASVKSGWRMCKAPVDYFKGGTWLSIPSKAKHIDEAKDFIKYVTTNKSFLKKRCLETGDFMNNKEVMNEIVADYHCDFLDGQNHYALLIDVANEINGNLISPYDAFIDSTYASNAGFFARETVTATKTLEQIRIEYKNKFRSSVKNKYRFIDTESYPN